MELPNGVIIRHESRDLVLTRNQDPACLFPELEGEHPILLPEEAGVEAVSSAGPWQVTTQVGMAGEEPHWAGAKDGWTACLDRRALGEGATLRAWRPGDRIQPLGMRGHKKLQDLFTDLQVPRHWRRRVPLLETEKGIAWVVGYRIADWAKVDTEAGEHIVWLRFSLSQDQDF